MQRLAGDTRRQASSDEVKELQHEMEQLKQLVAELAMKNRVLKKKLAWYGYNVERLERRSQAEKLEIIQLVEHSDLPITKTMEELDVPPSSFYRWDHKYQEDGYEGLANYKSCPHQYWNRIPDSFRDQVI